MMSEPRKSSGGIHPSAIVEDGASIAPDVTIGPFAVVGKNVSIASGSVLHSHVVVDACCRCRDISELESSFDPQA